MQVKLIENGNRKKHLKSKATNEPISEESYHQEPSMKLQTRLIGKNISNK